MGCAFWFQKPAPSRRVLHVFVLFVSVTFLIFLTDAETLIPKVYKNTDIKNFNETQILGYRLKEYSNRVVVDACR